MSIVYHLQFGAGAVGPEHVARELRALISGALVEDFEPSALTERFVALASGLVVDVSAPAFRQPLAITTTIGGTTTVVDFQPVAEVGFLPYKGEQLGALGHGEVDQYLPQHKDIMLAVLGLLDRVAGTAFISDDRPPWLLRHDGRLLVNELVQWDPPLLELIPKPISWASVTVR